MIRVIIELKLNYPYKLSLSWLLDFSKVWSCRLIAGGTNSETAVISMPAKKFKKIWGVNPRVKDYAVPAKAEKHLSAVKVKEIKVE